MTSPSIVILTGAGISAESGLATFRALDGLWCEHRVEDVATPQGFARNPELVQRFYNTRRAQLKTVMPNAAHEALAELMAGFDAEVLLVTQNVDDLHARAALNHAPKSGSELLHLHGELLKARCLATEAVFEWDGDIGPDAKCACCGKTGTLRPHIVWFGEMPFHMERIYAALRHCDLFVSIGTSGSVYPAAGFVQEVKAAGRGRTVEINLERSLGHSLFDEAYYGRATQAVPIYVKALFKRQADR